MNCQEMLKDLSDLNFTQTEIGRLTGLSQSYISELETGRKGERVGFEVVAKIKALWEKNHPPPPESEEG